MDILPETFSVEFIVIFFSINDGLKSSTKPLVLFSNNPKALL